MIAVKLNVEIPSKLGIISQSKRQHGQGRDGTSGRHLWCVGGVIGALLALRASNSGG